MPLVERDRCRGGRWLARTAVEVVRWETNVIKSTPAGRPSCPRCSTKHQSGAQRPWWGKSKGPRSGDERLRRSSRRGELPRLYPETQRRKVTQGKARRSLLRDWAGGGGGSPRDGEVCVRHGLPSHHKNTLEAGETMGEAGRYTSVLNIPGGALCSEPGHAARGTHSCPHWGARRGPHATHHVRRFPPFFHAQCPPCHAHHVRVSARNRPGRASRVVWVSVVCELHAR